MKRAFADTHFFLALVNTRDADHERSLALYGEVEREFVTTAWVLAEVAAALSPAAHRAAFVRLYHELASDPAVRILPASAESFVKGLELYAARPDKDWSLTDCISFLTMQAEGLAEALTGDRHFEQAGFRRLLG